MTQRDPASFGRILATPVVLLIAGYLIAGLTGLLIGAAIGIVYVLVASRRQAPTTAICGNCGATVNPSLVACWQCNAPLRVG